MSRSEYLHGGTITRRGFLRSTAAVGGTALAASAFGCGSLEPQQGDPEDATTVGLSFCGACQKCIMDVYARGNNVVRVEAHEIPGGDDVKRMCVRGASIPYAMVDPKRIQYPMKRAGERGEGKWERIGWDEAIGTVCSEIARIQSTYGKEAMCMHQYGATDTKFAFPTMRLLNIGEFSQNDSMLDATYATAMMNTHPGLYSLGNGQHFFRNLKLLVYWAHDPVVAWPNMWHDAADAIVGNNAKLVVVDPNFNTVASKAHLWVPVRPGSDGVLALGMINYLEAQGLAKHAFMKAKSNAPYLVREDGRYLRMSDVMDGVDPASDLVAVWDEDADELSFDYVSQNPALRTGRMEIAGHTVQTAYDLLLEEASKYPLSRTAEICDLPEETIVRFANMLAGEDEKEVYLGFGMEHQGNGLNTQSAVHCLRIVSGCAAPQNFSMAPNQTGFYYEETEHPVHGQFVQTIMFNDLIDKGEWDEIPGYPIKMPLKGIISFGANLSNSTANRNDFLKAYLKMEFMAYVNMFWTDTADIADIVLPAAMPAECSFVESINHCLVYSPGVVPPRFEAKSDYDICALIAKGLGLGEWFADSAEECWEKLIVPFAGYGITWDQLKSEGCIRFEDQPTALPFYYTMTGKLQVYAETNTYTQSDWGQPQVQDMGPHAVPTWEPPMEAWHEEVPGIPKREIAERYPLKLIAGTRRYKLHSFYGWVKALRELEVDEPCVRMNPADAEARGIADGDYVRLYNDRGQAVAKAVFHAGIRPGGLDIDRGWQASQYKAGCNNELTSSAQTTWTAPNSYFHDVVVEMEKWDGKTGVGRALGVTEAEARTSSAAEA